jgi:hypothetical protein
MVLLGVPHGTLLRYPEASHSKPSLSIRIIGSFRRRKCPTHADQSRLQSVTRIIPPAFSWRCCWNVRGLTLYVLFILGLVEGNAVVLQIRHVFSFPRELEVP